MNILPKKRKEVTHRCVVNADVGLEIVTTRSIIGH